MRRVIVYNDAMPVPLLRTKLTVPPCRPGPIVRPRLAASLQTGFDIGVRLILISAPAGSGKSTLATNWATNFSAGAAAPDGAPAHQFAWLSLDPADNERLQFWLGLIGALQVVLPNLGQAEQCLLAFSEAPPVISILTGLLNQIEAQPERIVLVLDDYHLISEPSIHEGIAFILEHMPGNMQLVIATRADPPLPLNRLRVRNQLREIRAADLFFTLSETEMLINDGLGLGLSPGDLAALEERTEGWAAGVQLAAALLTDERRKADNCQVAERLSALVNRLSSRNHLIADYLLDEVISRQPADVQQFLLETSILDALCAPLCDALLADGEEKPVAQAVLEYLNRANLFLFPLNEDHTWFRYHHLFADALRIRLERTQPGKSSLLHQRASRWFEQNGHAQEAVEHALAANDYGHAAGLIEANANDLARQGRHALLLGWLEALPAETVLAHPHLGILGSRALVLSGKLSAAEKQLQSVEATLALAPASAPSALRGQIAAVRATAAVMNADAGTAKELAQTAIDLLPQGDPSRAAVLLSFGDAALIAGEIPRGIQLLQEAVAKCRQSSDLSLLLIAFAHLGEGLWMQGSLRQVETICLDALDEVNSQLGAGD